MGVASSPQERPPPPSPSQVAAGAGVGRRAEVIVRTVTMATGGASAERSRTWSRLQSRVEPRMGQRDGTERWDGEMGLCGLSPRPLDSV